MTRTRLRSKQSYHPQPDVTGILRELSKKMGKSEDSKTLIEEAYRKIKHMIFLKKLAPGQRLVYSDLSKILNMSRTPIINALNRLEQQRLVASESFRGFYVRGMSIQEAWDALGVRIALETWAVEEAVKTGDTEGFEILEQKYLSHRNYNSTQYDRKKFYLDAEFHIQIAAMSKNRILKLLLKNNLEHVYLRAVLDKYDPDRMEVAVKEHRRLLDQMKSRDLIGSIETIKLHIEGSRKHVINCLYNNETEETFTYE